MTTRTTRSDPAVLTGIGLTLLAYFVFAFQDASIKWLVATLPVWQILCVRSVIITLACLAIGRRTLLHRMVTTPNRGALALRGGVTLVAWLCYYAAAAHLQLAEMLTVYFAAPIMVTVLAIPLLGEQVTPARWLSVGIGFAGVVVAANPFGASFGAPALLVLLAAALWAWTLILMRQIALLESSLVQLFSANLISLLATGTLAFTWRMPGGANLLLLAGIGLWGGIGQVLLFEGARRAPASVTSPLEYTSLIWAFVLGYLIWRDAPTPPVLGGAALILAAGLLLVLGERKRGAARRLAP